MLNPNKTYYQQLVDRFIKKKSTEEELEVFFYFLKEGELDEAILKQMNEEAGIEENVLVKPMHSYRKLWFGAAAAVIFFVLATGVWMIKNPKTFSGVTESHSLKIKNDIAPGHYGAVLTLSDGKKITLDSTANGVLTNDNHIKIVKKEESIEYDPSSNKNNRISEIIYNTVTTAYGRQWQLTLPDGTKVWLNAGSSITYPIAFVGNERRVSITGEAYFEVSHDAEKPFFVSNQGMEVMVLGTHFNVNAYADEPNIKVSLLEGSVRVKKDNSGIQAILIPGQQAQVGNIIHVDNDVDTEQVVAWKDNMFQFNNSDLQTVLRQFARWYDLKIVYEGKVTSNEFEGKIQRDVNLSDALMILEEFKIHFKLDGNTLIIKP